MVTRLSFEKAGFNSWIVDLIDESGESWEQCIMDFSDLKDLRFKLANLPTRLEYRVGDTLREPADIEALPLEAVIMTRYGVLQRLDIPGNVHRWHSTNPHDRYNFGALNDVKIIWLPPNA